MDTQGAIAEAFGPAVGAWQGANGFRLMPTDSLAEAPAAAELGVVGAGYHLVLRYTWVHPDDGAQDGVLLAGSPDGADRLVSAAWGDSWHQKPAVLVMTGTL